MSSCATMPRDRHRLSTVGSIAGLRQDRRSRTYFPDEGSWQVSAAHCLVAALHLGLQEGREEVGAGVCCAAKSDIKVVDLLGHGIPAVYSADFPYRSSDLDAVPLVDDDPRLWREAIEAVVKDPTRFAPEEKIERIRQQRSYQSIAPALGRVLVENARRSSPLPRPSFNAGLRSLEKLVRGWRARHR